MDLAYMILSNVYGYDSGVGNTVFIYAVYLIPQKNYNKQFKKMKVLSPSKFS